MELILLENIQNLGKLGEVVKVKSGFGRNFLVPQGKAVPASEQNRADFESRRAELEARAAKRHNSAENRCAVIADKTVTINANASSEGKLYGSVGTREIAEALTAAGYPVEKSEIILPEGALRQVGEYRIQVQLYAGVDCHVTLVIEGQET